jgi:hypothetical protein
MTRFLRLFPQFRAIEGIAADREAALDRSRLREIDRVAECQKEFNERLSAQQKAMQFEHDLAQVRVALQETTTEKLILQDRLDAAQESVSRLWGMVDAAQNRAYRAMESQVNFSTQMKFGVTPYPEASHLPPSLEPDLESDSIVRRRMAPSELIANQKRKLRDDLVERLTKTA